MLAFPSTSTTTSTSERSLAPSYTRTHREPGPEADNDRIKHEKELWKVQYTDEYALYCEGRV